MKKIQDGAQDHTGWNELPINLEFHHPQEVSELPVVSEDIMNVTRMPC